MPTASTSRRDPWFSRCKEFLLFGLQPSQYSWRGVLLLAAVYLGALLFAALAAPLVYHAIQLWHEVSPNRITNRIAHKSLPDYLDRLRWLAVLIALPLLLRHCGLLSWRQLGIDLRRPARRTSAVWFALGVLLIASAAAAQAYAYGAGWREDLTTPRAFHLLAAALAGGLAVGLLEEIVFRGMVFRMFYTALRPLSALLLTALFFSYAHFKYPKQLWSGGETAITLSTGIEVAWWTVFGILHNFHLLAFLNLLLFGLLLGLLVLRNRSLMPAIAFHAGIVCAILFYTSATTIHSTTRTEGVSLFWGTGGLRDGLVTTLAFLLILSLTWLFHRSERFTDSTASSRDGST